MMLSKYLRILVVVAAGALLLLPGLVMAYAWGGTLNLEVAFAATLLSIAMAIWLPRFKWFGAVVCALIVAVPPYPYWTNWDEDRGQYLHFFHGYNMQNLPIATFVVVFLMAMLVFTVIFRAIGKRPIANRSDPNSLIGTEDGKSGRRSD